MATDNGRKQGPEQSQESTLGQAILRFLGRLLGWILLSPILLFHGGAFALRFLWKHRRPVARNLWSSIFRVATLMSVSYLVYDRIWETEATIVSPASDPQDAFFFPFSIQNNSHLFTIRNIHWECETEVLIGPRLSASNNYTTSGTVSEISPGRNMLFQCTTGGRYSIPGGMTSDHPWEISFGAINIAFTYDVDARFFSFTRHPSATKFSWIGRATNPQWVKGDFAH
jgi:hypothetical protein